MVNESLQWPDLLSYVQPYSAQALAGDAVVVAVKPVRVSRLGAREACRAPVEFRLAFAAAREAARRSGAVSKALLLRDKGIVSRKKEAGRYVWRITRPA